MYEERNCQEEPCVLTHGCGSARRVPMWWSCASVARRRCVRLTLLCLAASLVAVVCLYGRLTVGGLCGDGPPCPRLEPQLRDDADDHVFHLSRRPDVGLTLHRLCVVVPFRDRYDELLVFAPHMHRFLSNQSLDFRILVMNQVDTLRFNRASLINVGYREALSTHCDYLCMHDVDLLPTNAELSYAWPTQGIAVHLASPEYHPRYNYTKFIGGILLLTLADYWRVDGMSNKYWGWGLEDDEFFLRLRDGHVAISRPTNLSTDRSDTFLHIHDKRVRQRDTLRIGNQRQMSRKRDRLSGVSSVQYRVVNRTELRVDAVELTIVNVELHCDRAWTPYCETTLAEDTLPESHTTT